MTVSNCGCGSGSQKAIACRSDGGILLDRQGADYVVSIQSQKPCVPRLLSGTASEFLRSRLLLPCRSYRCFKNLTPRRARFMPRRFGISPDALLPCAKTLAVITRSTSFRVH